MYHEEATASHRHAGDHLDHKRLREQNQDRPSGVHPCGALQCSDRQVTTSTLPTPLWAWGNYALKGRYT